MDAELKPLARHLCLRADRRRGGAGERVGAVGGVDVVLRRCGVGPARAADATAEALDRHRPDHVLVVGIAGGLGGGVAIGDVVVPAMVTSSGDGPTHRAAGLGALEPSGSLLTCARLMGWEDLAGHAADGVLAVDMESAGVAGAAEAAGVPWTAIRGISDMVGDDVVTPDAIDLVREDGSTDAGAVARLVVRHPGRVGALAAMAKGSARAMSGVCRAVADALDVPSAGGGGAPAPGRSE
jgi:adenosylhomocysteine nucleosidase